MRVLVVGGSGVVGSRLIPPLVAGGHQVVATTRRQQNASFLRELGATGITLDVYDAPHTAAVVRDAAPDLIVDQLSDLSDFDFEANARLRRAGTANLVAAAQAAGTERVIAQSIAWAYEPGHTAARETDPLIEDTAVAVMEAHVRRMPRSTILRYGRFYGPGTWYADGGRVANAAAAGLLRATPAMASFVHIDDVITATVAAIDWPDGVYNVVDDDSAPAEVWMPVFARKVGAPIPRLVPLPAYESLGRPVSNAKARALGWVPAYPSWREGFPSAGSVGDG